ncbi:MAG: EAL domain-containing protein [Actinobacteria bacterium]|nr:EAL domain-containing protein [Actinomycetota bacterium]
MSEFFPQFDIAALFILGILLVNFTLKRQTYLFQTRLYRSYLIFSIVSVALDILTLITFQKAAIIPPWINYALNGVFLAMQFIMPAFFATYMLTVMGKRIRATAGAFLLLSIPALVGAITMLLFNYSQHWYFYFDETFKYMYGPYHSLLYFNVALYAAVTLMATVIVRKRINKFQLQAIVSIDIIAFVAVVIQALFPSYLVGGFGVALCLLMMYLSFQNPNEEIDPLTKIPNRNSFHYNTEHMLRKNPDVSYLLVYMNIEHFKIINDLFGARIGDRILMRLADQLRRYCRGIGTYGRLEGDHFVFCLPDDTFELEDFLAQTDKGCLRDIVDYDVRVTLGLYVIDDRTIPLNLMCDRAYMALQNTDRDYLTRYSIYDNALRASMIEEHEILEEMSGALESGQFILYYQPVYDLATKKIISAEALVRWNHPEKGLISPGKFIALFEKHRFILKLDYFVWETACMQLRTWIDQGMVLFPISVNFSRINLYNQSLLYDVIGLVEKYGLDPSLLKFEITESCYMEDADRFLSVITGLQKHGFTIMMDDFGSGYSSLSMLKDTPFDQLKIDMRFLMASDDYDRGEVILSTIVEMANRLDLFAIAEGVETKEQADFLAAIGCDAAQGYYFSRPVPSAVFESLV